MTYIINDIFYTIQGEGYWSGRAAVFCRFSRCNLWTGREADRASAVCNFCDTDFTAGIKMDLGEVVTKIRSEWVQGGASPMVVFTGGEPLLQLDEKLIEAVKNIGFYTAVETNGTMPIPSSLDWVCVSPKILTRTVANKADELKLVYPQLGVEPQNFDGFDATVRWLSPMDGPNLSENTDSAVAYVKNDPRWRLNVQTHKLIGVK